MERSFSFVDSHCHFWDPGRLPCPWLVEVPLIAGAHTPRELAAESEPAGPSQIVFVQAGSEPADREVQWVEDLAAGEEPRIAGIVAFTPVDRGAVTRAALDRLGRRPLIRGIRHLIQGEPDPGFCVREEFIAGVRRVGELGLSFDLCIRDHQLPAATALVRACPATSFVLDHLGKPPIRAGRLDPWRDDLARLATLPNITAKLSGLIAEADPLAWTVAHLRPFADHALRVFGPDRLMFGSDWPVVKIGSGYAHWVSTARSLLESVDPAAQRAVFSDTARRVYRLAA